MPRIETGTCNVGALCHWIMVPLWLFRVYELETPTCKNILLMILWLEGKPPSTALILTCTTYGGGTLHIWKWNGRFCLPAQMGCLGWNALWISSACRRQSNGSALVFHMGSILEEIPWGTAVCHMHHLYCGGGGTGTIAGTWASASHYQAILIFLLG